MGEDEGKRRESQGGTKERMIQIKPSPTADTRSCDCTQVTKDQLAESSRQHIEDVTQALYFFVWMLQRAARKHDEDKLTNIEQFHADFLTGFRQHTWWDEHRKLNRHHLDHVDGIREDVNLIDVLEHLADCVMAGMARTGQVFPLYLPGPLLERAFQNTVELLKKEVEVVR